MCHITKVWALFLMIGAFNLLAATPPTPDMPKLLKETQAAWKAAKTFKSPFSQSVKSKFMGTSDVSEGTITVVKPDRFRWESKTDGSIQILKGKELTLVQPKAQRGKTVVDIYPDFSKQADPKFLDLLAGTVDLAQQYTPKFISQNDTQVVVDLKAKKADQPSYIAEISKKGYLLLALSYEDESTLTRMEFKDPQTNASIDEGLFSYQPAADDIVNRHK